MKKGLLITGAILLIVVFGGWTLINQWTNTPYGKLDTRTAIEVKLLNASSKFINITSVAKMRDGLVLKSKLLASTNAPEDQVINKKIPGTAGPIPVRIYIPKHTGLLPVVLFYHGGGWVMGDLNTHDIVARNIARYGQVIVISVDYRLAPENPFPAAPEDCYSALLWANQNAADYGGDASRLGVCGDSAGGNLAAVTSLTARDRKGPKISAQVLLYPVTDISNMNTESYRDFAEGYFLTKEQMEQFRDMYTPNTSDWTNPEVSPLLAKSLSNLPPALVITNEFDPLRDEGEAYAARLKAAGVKTSAVRYPGMIHGFLGSTRLIPQAEQAAAEVGKFLNKELAQP